MNMGQQITIKGFTFTIVNSTTIKVLGVTKDLKQDVTMALLNQIADLMSLATKKGKVIL